MSTSTLKAFRQTDKENKRMAEAMKVIGMENDSEFIRDAIRRRCEQIERQEKRRK
jgi:Arc/MetJ family transcription regulator